MLDERVEALLAPNETPLVYELAHQLGGHNAIGGDRNPRPEVGMDWDPFSGGVVVNSDWMSAKTGGISAQGATGSIADGFNRALNAHMCSILLTDRRLALAADVSPLTTMKTNMQLTMSIDRRAVRAIVGKRRLLQAGRVQITFVDGSWVTAMMGMFSARPANRLIAAFGSARY